MGINITTTISASVVPILALILFCATTATGLPLRANGKIAFTSDRDGNPEIYLMNADGTNQTRLTNNSIVDDHPMWSPDGTKLAFVSQRTTGGFAISQMKPDGRDRVEITPLNQFVNTPPSGVFGFSMSWSPDGRKIAFQDPRYNDIFVVDVETGVRQNLTNDGGGQTHLYDYHPAWSPDGSTILYATPLHNGLCPNLWLMNPDGTNRRLLSAGFCPAYSPSWSPDGENIVFVQLNGEWVESELRIANSDGTNVRIFDGGFPDLNNRDYPRWSPDGRKIAFNLAEPSGIDIYKRNVDGTGYQQLTKGAGRNYRPSWQPLAKAAFDFDGDGRSDLSVFRPSDGVWFLNRSTNGFSATQFGLSTDKITPADYDGDGKTDISVFRDGIWYWIDSSNGSFRATHFGLASDIPLSADFTGDGRAEFAIYRNGAWWNLDLSNAQTSTIQFGLPTDKPVVADYDGDGRADQAVYRNGEWHLNRSSLGYSVVQFGLPTDRPVVGDYDGDGRGDLAVFRDGVWYLQQSTNGLSVFQFGQPRDLPTPADYDGDGKTDAAVFRNGQWLLRQSAAGLAVQHFGLLGDKPLQSAFLP